ncbi:protein SSUH2 homolog isoform X3 [Sceloporus undulatus]|uniref:protein SSUH2 homolog isoform X3 n=1 Tax=Sceloporus undulatus TaxID=8520 RepID=UPI001C4D5932|nr:protein SSUH2 homolog isoform X3 [Sceloporus undulatus]
MEKDLLIGDKSITNYGSDDLLSPRIAQGTSGHSSPFEGASAPPYELMEKTLADEKKSTEDSAASLLLNKTLKKPFGGMHPYRLETFTETRETCVASEFYNGGFVDSSAVAPPPAPWEIMVDPPPLFTDCEMHLPIPHSYSVENCPNCKGCGAIRCQSCEGTGKKKCSACGGSGTNTLEGDNICSWCSGTGDSHCFSCRSNGWLKCYRCSGNGVLLFHTELTITWKNNILEHLADKDPNFPIYLLQEATGEEILCDENFSVFPIIDFPETSIEDYSRACIEQHRMQLALGSVHHILKQKQTIELVPLTKVEYEWKGKLYSFYVFGKENKVYTKGYPAKCCCSVM